ncbi:MAG: transcription initiation factor IIB family protein [Sulfobacillus sp.]
MPESVYVSELPDKDGDTRCSLLDELAQKCSSLSTAVAPGPRGNYLRQLQNWESCSYQERRLREIIKKISVGCRLRGLPKNIADTASGIYQQISESLNRHTEAIMSSCVYHACQLHGEPLSYGEVAEMFGLEAQNVQQSYCIVLSILEAEAKVPDYRIYLSKFGRSLGLAPDVLSRTLEIADRASQHGLAESVTPQSFAAGCLYFANLTYDLKLSRTLIAKHCKVSVASVAKPYSVLSNHLEKLLV